MALPQRKDLVLSDEVQKRLVAYVNGILTLHKKNASPMHEKMEAIDIAYARYVDKGNPCNDNESDGVDRSRAGSTPCDAYGNDKIIAPIVVSQVDSTVGYLAEVFLSGSPIFPVVSSPAKRKWAEQLETLVDDHATLGGYARQLLLFLRDGVKYNFSAIEADWDMIDQFSVTSDFTQSTGRAMARTNKFFTSIKRWDPYNTIYDYSVAPADIAKEGDFAGHIEIISKTKLKRLLNKYSATSSAYNATEAMNANGNSISGTAMTMNYHVHPTISDYITAKRPDQGMDWEGYITGIQSDMRDKQKMSIVGGTAVEKVTIYARIIPSDFGIPGPQPNQAQIYKLVVINSQILIHAKRIISAQDYLPVLFGQPSEDGLAYQTKSIAEGEIDIQEGVSTLFAIRFNASRRSISDRALYDPNIISQTDVNAKTPAAKIPVKISAISTKKISEAYYNIPFDGRGTEGTIRDAAMLADFSKQLSGLNGPQQGQFQKGNKSVDEFDRTMGGSDNRLRLPALCLEYQVFVPLKAIIALNIFQHAEDVQVVSQKTGEELDIKIDELRKHVLAFRIADGYTPKSKLASTDMLAQGLNIIMNAPLLQQAYGTSLPAMFAHMMSLGGVKGLEQYDPAYIAQQEQEKTPQGLETNALQSPAAASLLPPQPAGPAPLPAQLPTGTAPITPQG